MATPLKSPRWARKLKRELAVGRKYSGFSESEWQDELVGKRITSSNHDTYLALDWPHYCYAATVACGGANGWCYTFQGHQASRSHESRVALVDALAREAPTLFAQTVVHEVMEAVSQGHLPYPNLRYSGSGECAEHHLPALSLVAAAGVRLWGFTRQPSIAVAIRTFGGAVIFSCDKTTDASSLAEARRHGLPLAYTSSDVSDIPPEGTLVVFPLHRGGRVREVVQHDAICPKVLDDFFLERRPPNSCQSRCIRCHQLSQPLS
jgi:hypothetical protein